MKSHPLHWVIEPLREKPSYEERAMFGCRACYLFGEMKLVLASKSFPWKGLLIPTDQTRHAVLLSEFPSLLTHPVLKKWLYLPEDQEEFEETAAKLVNLIARNDKRIGVEPKEKSPPKAKNAAPKKMKSPKSKSGA